MTAQVGKDNIHAVDVVIDLCIQAHALSRIRIAVHTQRKAVVSAFDRGRNVVGVDPQSVVRPLIPVLSVRVVIHPAASHHVRRIPDFLVPAGIALDRLHGIIVEIIRDSDQCACSDP